VPEPRYAIVKPIASGGMGAVYLGRREGADGFTRLVALKRAHAALASDADHRKRLLREATLASRIHHVNVVSVVDVFERTDELWLVLDWIDGSSLAALRTAGPLPPAIALRLVLDAATGLAAAHELIGEDGEPAGLRHGDVSPQNVLVGKDGIARLADFGLAKSLDATLTATEDRFLEGKLGYVAPELLAGRPVSEASDLYAMGVVAWETLSGERLFAGRTIGALSSEQQEPRSVSSVAPGLAPFDAVVGRALAFEPEARHESVRGFIGDLERAGKAHGAIATPLEVAAYVRARTYPVVERPSAVTPATGLVDPETPIVTDRSALLDDAPTAIVGGHAKATAARRRPPAALLAAAAMLAAGGVAAAMVLRRPPAPPTAAPSASVDLPPAEVAAPPRARSADAHEAEAAPPEPRAEGSADRAATPTATEARRPAPAPRPPAARAPGGRPPAPSPEGKSSIPPVPDNPYRTTRPTP
jgi:eukaryotic-like serine/threonine-protein kinase